ncbi:MAG: hypothetical protein ACREB3_03525 [Burkholderiales bacterium]
MTAAQPYTPQPVTLTTEVFALLTPPSNAERAALWTWKRSGHGVGAFQSIWARGRSTASLRKRVV